MHGCDTRDELAKAREDARTLALRYYGPIFIYRLSHGKLYASVSPPATMAHRLVEVFRGD